MLLYFVFLQLYANSMKNKADKEEERFKKFEGHLAYLIYSRMSKWIRTDVDDMQRKFNEFNPKPYLMKQETERLKLEAPPQDPQEQMQLALLKQQDEERQQKEQAAAIKQYWESIQPELNSFSRSSDDAVKKAAGMKILEISEDIFSLDYLKQQYLYILADYVQPLQESEADKAQKEKVLEAVYQELYGWAI